MVGVVILPCIYSFTCRTYTQKYEENQIRNLSREKLIGGYNLLL
jgi:hypothetical protein